MAADPAPDDDTAFVPVPTEAAPELAWALDEDEPEQQQQQWQPWSAAAVRAGVLVLGAVVVIGVIGVIGAAIRTPAPARPIIVRAPATTITVQATPEPTLTTQAPRPSATTRTSEPTVSAPATPYGKPTFQPTAEGDQQFLTGMANAGTPIPAAKTALALHYAHEVCRRLREDVTTDEVNHQIAMETGGNDTNTLSFTSGVILYYPNCL